MAAGSGSRGCSRRRRGGLVVQHHQRCPLLGHLWEAVCALRTEGPARNLAVALAYRSAADACGDSSPVSLDATLRAIEQLQGASHMARAGCSSSPHIASPFRSQGVGRCGVAPFRWPPPGSPLPVEGAQPSRQQVIPFRYHLSEPTVIHWRQPPIRCCGGRCCILNGKQGQSSFGTPLERWLIMQTFAPKRASSLNRGELRRGFRVSTRELRTSYYTTHRHLGQHQVLRPAEWRLVHPEPQTPLAPAQWCLSECTASSQDVFRLIHDTDQLCCRLRDVPSPHASLHCCLNSSALIAAGCIQVAMNRARQQTSDVYSKSCRA